jgi:hypothetical protein
VIFLDKTILILTIAWLGGIPLAILNAGARNNLYGSYVNELQAHQISSFTAMVLFALYFWVLNKKWNITSPNQAFLIGFNWLILTVIFEFLFGHYVMDHPWDRLLHDYDISAGRLWSLVLLWNFIGPYVIFRLSHR